MRVWSFLAAVSSLCNWGHFDRLLGTVSVLSIKLFPKKFTFMVYFGPHFWSWTVHSETHKIILVIHVSVLWHLWIWFVYVVGSSDSSADRLSAPVRELSALKLRLVEHVSWIINTPGFGDVPAAIILVYWCNLDRNTQILSDVFLCQNSLTHESSHSIPAVRIYCPLIGHNSFAPGAYPLLSYITPFGINIG